MIWRCEVLESDGGVCDDAQSGSDHLDALHTAAFTISPYRRRKSVDCTMYSTVSVLRTLELIRGA
jgi:hypothetical protein